MAAGSSSLSVVAPKHFVRLYDEDRALTDFVAQFVESGLGAGGAAILVATPEHMRVVVSELERAGTDLKRAIATHRLTLLDARTTLDALMLDGMPDPKRFRAVVLDALVPAVDGGTNVRAFGEMVDLLWQDGNPRAALALERLWNELALEHEFALLCGYRDRPTKQPFDESFADVCRLHSHVVKRSGDVVMGDPNAPHDAVLQLLSANVQVLGWQRDANKHRRRKRVLKTTHSSAPAKLDWSAVARLLAERATSNLLVIDRAGIVRLWSDPLASAIGIKRAAIEGRVFIDECTSVQLQPIIRSIVARAWLSPLRDCAFEVLGGGGRPYGVTVSSEVIGRRSQQALLLTVSEVRPLSR
jgi:hypothetical protein